MNIAFFDAVAVDMLMCAAGCSACMFPLGILCGILTFLAVNCPGKVHVDSVVPCHLIKLLPIKLRIADRGTEKLPTSLRQRDDQDTKSKAEHNT